ncbi:MAG: DoxX family protein [Candidatus Paceibacterota bacterium]
MNTKCYRAWPLVGRILLSAIFIMSGVHKVFSWNQTSEQMANEGMVMIPLFLVGAILCEVGGGLSVLLGCWARVGAMVLIAFLIPTTLIFHDFWTYEGQEQQMQMAHFMKNLAIMGGLVLVLSFGAGPISVNDRSTVASPSTEPSQ